MKGEELRARPIPPEFCPKPKPRACGQMPVHLGGSLGFWQMYLWGQLRPNGTTYSTHHLKVIWPTLS